MKTNTENETNYEAKKLLYENSKDLSRAQDERKNIIDNKANILLTIVLVMLGILIEFAEIEKIFTVIPNEGLAVYQIVARAIIAVNFYAISIVLNLCIIIKLVLILKGKNYRTINPQNFTKEEAKQMSEVDILDKFIDEYANNVETNSKTNAKQMKQFDTCTVLFIISLFFIVATYIGIELVKGGIL